MDSDHPGWQLILLFVLILANGVFSATEIAVVSAKKLRLQREADNGSAAAQAALDIAQNPNRLFSTIQIGITAIGVITGMVGASTLAEPLAEQIARIDGLTAYAQALSLLIIMSGVTYFTLILGELVPKRIAINAPEAVTMAVARPMSLFARINTPIIWFMSASTGLVLRILGIRIVDEQPVSEEEIRFLLRQGAQLGTFDAKEPELIDRIFRLNDIPAENIMTARPQLVWLDLATDETELEQLIIETRHTRLPVGYESLDDFRGLVRVQDLLVDRLRYPQRSWNDLIRRRTQTPLYIPETLTLNKALDLFRIHSAHEAIILDEYGAPEGLITLNDIMEEIIGTIPASVHERLAERNRIVRRSADSWLIDGLLPIEEFKQCFQIHTLLPKEGEDYYKTLGGFVIFLCGYLPKEADTITYEDFTFEVVDTDNFRIDKVLVTRTPPPPQETMEEED